MLMQLYTVAQLIYLEQRRRVLYFLAWRTKVYTYFLGVKYVADVLHRFQPGYWNGPKFRMGIPIQNVIEIACIVTHSDNSYWIP